MRGKAHEMFRFCTEGYRLRQILQEVYGDDALRYMQLGGFRLRRDYGAHFGDAAAAALPHPRPYLMGIDRDEALRDAGSTLSFAFASAATPRLFFRAAERDVLRHALLGESDAEIATSLCVSRETVRKRWRAIYDRVAAVDVAWFPQTKDDPRGEAGRGAEKRRHLLGYLRHHPEELRPATPPD